MKYDINSYEEFKKAIPIIDKIVENGHDAFFVGGSVRDLLIGRPIGDIDIASSAKPEEIISLFDKVIPIGIDHGTVMVRHKGESYEITTFRTEEDYQDHRHPDKVEFINDVKEDLSRRDFTINAIAMDKNGDLVDPFEGQKAIENKVIKAVGDPLERFEEDPLRMMRAVRFVSQLGYEIEKETYTAIKKQAGWLKKIAVERIAIEFEKMYAGLHVTQAIDCCLHARIHESLPVFQEYPNWLEQSGNFKHPLKSFAEIVAYYCYTFDSFSTGEWAKLWKLSKRTKNDAQALMIALDQYKKMGLRNIVLYSLPEHLTEGFSRLAAMIFDEEFYSLSDRVSAAKLSLPIQKRNELEFQGGDLLALYPDEKPGPWMAEILDKVEEKVVSKELRNDYNEIKEWLIKWNPPGRK
ncbi:CCA tRNA nucleotidyltransferase [Thalassobacillus pellis]|uniref:CCA tRNA nucleotidyltransferase n=1 Tax=Thalassobacillus pellis TaxID=748008 RepID=UPI0019602615|nr:CCA tRNA nucleotidyltransferase [Thalassobacillus pellis]MBM7552487.1 tRNA nucleotidyltransferase (CCA-adding enzyme) [Thalassobacillus pellis]